MRIAPGLILLLVCGFAGCCKHPAPTAVKSAAPALTLTDSSGRACQPLDASDGRRATVILFLMHDCPVANAMAPALARLVAEFEPCGVRFFGVYAMETAEEINAHREAWQLPFPGLMDGKMELAVRAGATRVPEAAVYAPDGELLYRGRIDDRAVSPGVTRPYPQREDLRLALEAVLAGRRPDPAVTKAIGCYLPVP